MLLSHSSPPAGEQCLAALRSLVSRGRHAEADRIAQAQRRPLPAAQSRAFLVLRAEIAIGLGRFASALEWAREAIKRAESGPDLWCAIEALRIRALLGLGRVREAQGAIESRFSALDVAGVDLSVFRGQVALQSGRLDEAVRAADRACALAATTRQRVKLVEALVLRARAGREAGDTGRARIDLDRAHRLSNGLRDTSVLASVLSDCADLMAHSGEWSEAAKNAARSGRLFARAFSPHEHLSAGRRTGLLGLAQGDPDVALPSIEKAAAVARRGFGSTQGRAEIDLLLADAQLAGRDPEGALERATAALSSFRHAQDPGGAARAHVRRSLAALSASNLPLALREARAASAVEGAGLVAEGLADLALGRVLLWKDPSCAGAPFDRAASNRSLYPPLRSAARLGAALSRGAAPCGDEPSRFLEQIDAFGDQRIQSLVRSDLRDLYGFQPPVASRAGQPGGSGLPVQPEDRGLDPAQAEFLPGLVGASETVRRLADLVRRAAPSDLPISILGETGTGKEKIAEALHHFSLRSSREFVPLNAASLSDELFESELFGHVRGSFTGAQTDRPGLVERARGGTLFIDEVADLSPRGQVRLLRFLQEGTYRRVGENHERRADVRIVVAANQPLDDLARAGRFRLDLLYRLQGVCLTAPPLRDRGSDVVRLARHFVALASGKSKRLSPHSEAELIAHAWPGNIRELELEMRRGVLLAESSVVEWRRPVSAASPVEPAPGPVPLHEALDGFERTFLKSVLSQCAERVEAARLLGISRQALHQKIVRFGL